MPQDPLLLTNDFEGGSEVDPINETRTDIIGKAVDYLEVDVASGNVSLVTTFDGDGDAVALRYASFKFTGTPGIDRTITLPALKSTYDVWNNTGDGSSLIFQTSGSPLPATITVADGSKTTLKVSDVFDVEDWGGGSAANIGYDNSTSGLAATTVQDAIDELAAGGIGGGGGGSAEGGWTTDDVQQGGGSPAPSTIDFTGLDATREYRVRFHGVNFSGSTSLAFRISMGAGFVSGSSYNRAYGEHGDSTALTDGNLTGQTLVAMSAAGATTNAWGELQFQPAEQASIETPIAFVLRHTLSNEIKEYFGAGSYATLTAAIDGIRFLAADGSSTIDAGTFILESRPLTPETVAKAQIDDLGTFSASGGATIDCIEGSNDWTLYHKIELEVLVQPDTDGATMWMRVDAGSGFISTGTPYGYAYKGRTDGSVDVNVQSTGANQIEISGVVGTASGEGYEATITMRDPAKDHADGYQFFRVQYEAFNSSTVWYAAQGGANWRGISQVVGVRFMASTGNVTGSVYVRGHRKSAA